MLLYYITDRKGLTGTDAQQRRRLLVRIGEATRAGVDYIQLREKDLAARDLGRLAREAVRMVRENSPTTKLLINGRADVALAAGADGVHLPAGELAASDVRGRWVQAGHRMPLIGVSAHTIQEVRAAEADGADFAVLAPIFEKANTGVQAFGIAALQAARSAGQPRNHAHASPEDFAIFALGGVTVANARACLAAGAAGIAGIRLFQSGDIGETVRRLRELEPIPKEPC